MRFGCDFSSPMNVKLIQPLFLFLLVASSCCSFCFAVSVRLQLVKELPPQGAKKYYQVQKGEKSPFPQSATSFSTAFPPLFPSSLLVWPPQRRHSRSRLSLLAMDVKLWRCRSSMCEKAVNEKKPPTGTASDEVI